MANRDALLSLAGTTLAAYLDDPAVIEVLINPNETCFVERFGLGMRESLAPRVADLDRFLAAIAHETQQEWRDAHPSLHASLADIGWRIQACRPPQAPGLTMALRKHPAQAFTLDEYLDQAILTETSTGSCARRSRTASASWCRARRAVPRPVCWGRCSRS